jgi:uncharacterized protein YxjI
MKNIKRYEDFINEEINLKKALVGGVIAASTLSGCDSPNQFKRPGAYSPSDIEYSTEKSEQVELPSSMIFSQKFLTIGTDMTILDNNNKEFGKVEERILSWGKKFEYLDNSGKLVASAKQRVFSLYTVIDITDASGSKLGSVEQEVIESLFSIYSIYSIKDASGKVVAKSKKLSFFKTDVDITDNNGGSISMSKDFINMFGDTWRLDMNSDIDRRLLVFIPSFISSAQQERENNE